MPLLIIDKELRKTSKIDNKIVKLNIFLNN